MKFTLSGGTANGEHDEDGFVAIPRFLDGDALCARRGIHGVHDPAAVHDGDAQELVSARRERTRVAFDVAALADNPLGPGLWVDADDSSRGVVVRRVERVEGAVRRRFLTDGA